MPRATSFYQATQSLALYRTITPAFLIATIILFVVYVIIAAEWMHRAPGGLSRRHPGHVHQAIPWEPSIKTYFILSFDDAMQAIDLNVIFLLMGMMIIVGVMKKTGLFQWLALQILCAGPWEYFCPVGHPHGGDRHRFRLSGQRHHHAADDPGDHRDRRHP